MKELTKYIEEKRTSGPNKDLIKVLEFPNEGSSLRWKTCDILRHVFTIKKYRRSSKGQKSRTSEGLPQIAVTGMEVSVSDVPFVASELPIVAPQVSTVAPHGPVRAPEVPNCASNVSVRAPDVGRINKVMQEKTATVQKEKTPRVQKPSLKVREQAS